MILAKIVEPAVVPPTLIIKPIPTPANTPPKIVLTIISSEEIDHVSVKCKNKEWNETAMIV